MLNKKKMNFKQKEWTLGTLKIYLRKNGITDFKNKSVDDLRKMAENLDKAKSLLEEEEQKCNNCNKIIDNCNCNRCNFCYEIIKECNCDIKNKEPVVKELVKEDNLDESSDYDDSSSYDSVITIKDEDTSSYDTLNTDECNFKLKDKQELELYALKIRVKIFMTKNILNNNSMVNDVLKFMNLLCKKYNIILEEVNKKRLDTIMKIISNKEYDIQHKILKDFLSYLHYTDINSFDLF